MYTKIILPVLALASTVLSAPVSARDVSAVDIILKMAPSTATCAATGDFASECATAVQAAPYLIKAFADWEIYNYPEMAAVLANILFESGNFKYNIHHFPSLNPGQGTRNMQNVEFNLQYARDLGLLANSPKGISPTATVGSLTTQNKNDLLDLVSVPEYTWGSSAWLLVTHCASARAQIVSSGLTGFTNYMTCIGATGDSAARTAIWQQARTAFGLSY